MLKLGLERILRGVIMVGAFAVFLTPLIIVNNFFVPFIFPKAMFFRVLTEIMLVCYLTLLISNFKKYRPRWFGLLTAISLFTFIMILATIFSTDRYTSFWGTLERMEGALAFLHYWVFLVILTVFFKNWRDWFKIFNFSVFVSLLIDVYSVLQKMGWSAVVGSGPEDRMRSVGTIGNPAFLAAYLMFNCLVLMILFFKTKIKNQRWAYGLIFVFHLAIIYLTNTRGALLGLLVGFFLFAVFYYFSFPQSRLRKYLVVALLVLVASVGFLFAGRNQPWVKQNSYLAHLTDVSLDASGSIKTRILAWQIGWQGFQEKPFLGWGPENYQLVFNKYFKSEYLSGFDQTVWYDRAHNIIVETVTTMGILGLISYLAIFVYLFLKLFRYWRQTEEASNKLVAVAIMVALIAYFIQNIFIFDTINSYIMLFLIFAYVNYLLAKPIGSAEEIPAKPIKIWLVPVFLAIGFIPFVRSVVHPALANGYGALSKAYFTAKAPGKGFDLMLESFRYNTFCDEDILSQMADSVNMMLEIKDFPEEKKIEYLEAIIKQGQKMVELHPLNVRRYMVLAKSYARLATYDDRNKVFYLAQSVKYLEEAVPLSPKRQQIYNELAFAHLRLGHRDEAVRILQQIIADNDRIPQFRWNLFLAYEELDEDELAQQALEKAIELKYPFAQPDNFSAAAHVIDFYSALKQYEKTLPYYDILIANDPNNAQWYSRLAVVYGKLGDKKKAQELALKVLAMDPNYGSQVQAFLVELEKQK